jgi:hypothetical protein
MVIAGGLFAGGAASFAWSRVPIWRRMTAAQFLGDFSQTIAWTDKVQPALLVAAIIASAGFVLTSEGVARMLAVAGATGFVVTLIGSLAVLVPLQRALIATPVGEREAIEGMRLRWFRGNLGRSLIATAAFALVATAAAM